MLPRSTIIIDQFSYNTKTESRPNSPSQRIHEQQEGQKQIIFKSLDFVLKVFTNLIQDYVNFSHPLIRKLVIACISIQKSYVTPNQELL